MDGLLGPLLVTVLVLAAAGSLKTLRPQPTATVIAAFPLALGDPARVALARLLGIFEVAVSIWALTTLSSEAFAVVAGLYVLFAAFVLSSLSGSLPVASCGCFGSDDSPPTVGHLVFNAVAAGLASIAASQNMTWSEFDLDVIGSVILLVAVLAGTALSVLALAVLPSVLSLANGSSIPVRVFEVDPHLRNQVSR